MDNNLINLIQVDFQLQIMKNSFHLSTLLILALCFAFLLCFFLAHFVLTRLGLVEIIK